MGAEHQQPQPRGLGGGFHRGQETIHGCPSRVGTGHARCYDKDIKMSLCQAPRLRLRRSLPARAAQPAPEINVKICSGPPPATRSEEHTSELQSLMRISYAVFCLKKTTIYTSKHIT